MYQLKKKFHCTYNFLCTVKKKYILSEKKLSFSLLYYNYFMFCFIGSTHNEFFNEIVFGNCLKSIKSITRVVNQKEKNKKSKKSNGAAAKPSQLTQVSKCVVMVCCNIL